ncbi:MAG: tetratricopeptide repeat protein [Betaproteobacteria bacterium]
MKKSVVISIVLVVAAAGAVLAYQVVARDHEYRRLLERGDAALAGDQTFGAIEAYSGAIALRPDSMLGHLRRAEAYQRRGEFEPAARDFRVAAALDPTAVRPLDELGDVRMQQQRYADAAETYTAALHLDQRAPRIVYKLALARYRDGHVDDAVGAVEQALRLDDRMADACYLLGMCLRDEHRDDEARRALERAVAQSPGLIPAREELADVYAALGRPGDELAQLQVLAGLDRTHIERQVAVGLAHARAGHPDLAVLTLGSALEHAPNEPLIYAALGRVWLEIAEARNDRVALSKALEALARVATMPGASSEDLTLYGRALLADGQVEQAERTLQQAVGRFPVDPAAFLFYATAAERLRHFDDARRALASAVALAGDRDREFVPRATRIAVLSLRLNDAATAVRWLDRAVHVSPTDTGLLGSLAEAELRAGRRDEARATLRRALEIDPSDKTLASLAARLR